MPVWKFGSKQKEEEQPEEEEVEEVEVDSNGDEVEYVEEEVEVTDDGEEEEEEESAAPVKKPAQKGCLEYSRKLSECKDPGGRESLDAIICSWKANSKRSGRMCPCFRKVGCLVSKSFA